MNPRTCACGERVDLDVLPKVGWRSTGGGDWSMMRRCVCGREIDEATTTDAARCAGCRRLVTGESDDPHVCKLDPVGPVRVFCRRCVERSAIQRVRQSFFRRRYV